MANNKKNTNGGKPDIQATGEGIVNVNNAIDQSLDSHIRKQKEIIASFAKQLQHAKELHRALQDLEKSGTSLNDTQKKQLADSQKLIDVNKKQRDNLKELKKLEEERFKSGVGNLNEYETALRSIGNQIGKNSDLFKASNAILDSQKVSLKSIDKFIISVGKGNKELAKQAAAGADAYKDMFTSAASISKDIKKGTKNLDDYNDAIIESAENFQKVIDSIDVSTKKGKQLAAVLMGMKGEMDGLANSAKKSQKQLAAMDRTLDQIGSSGIPLANELSDTISSVARGGKGAAVAFTALGAAAGAMFAKVIPGLAQMNAKLKAGNDIIQTQIDLRKELAKIRIESGFIPQKIEMERFQNMMDGQMEVMKLQVESQFIAQKISKERLSNEIESANTVNRAMIDAQYAAQRAANSFNAQMKSGAAQFAAAAKTARSGGEQLGDVGYNTAQLQLAGISADQISGAMTETAALLGSMPTEKLAADMSVFAKMSGVAENEIAEIADAMNLVDGYSLETSLNLQAGVKQLAKRSNLSYSNLMKGIAKSSKKMLEYGIKNSQQLVKQVAYAQSIGADFNNISDAGRNMVLNYKDSIKAEMQLSAILGKQIDFSEVRLAFAEGDPAAAMEALKRSNITAEDLQNVFAQDAFQKAFGNIDLDSALKMLSRDGKEAGDLQSEEIKKGNNRFLKRFTDAQKTLSAQEAIIQADAAIIDAKLSEKITDAYLKSPGYTKYQQSLNDLAIQQAQLSTEITDAWLNSPGNLMYQRNLSTQAQRQAKLNQMIEEAFFKSKEYQQSIIDQEKLDLRRQFTENLVPLIGGLGGGALFNIIGSKLFGAGGGGSGFMSLFGGGGGGGAAGTGMLAKAGPIAAALAGFWSIGKGAYNVGSREALNTGEGGGWQTAGNVIAGIGAEFVNVLDNVTLGATKWLAEKAGVSIEGVSTSQMEMARAAYRMQTGEQIGVGREGNQKLIDWIIRNRDMLTQKGMGDVVETFQQSIADGNISISREMEGMQENQEAARRQLESDMAFNRQVDINYYKKTLDLNEQQLLSLEEFNKQALSAEWLKNPPKWYLESGGKDTTKEASFGSGFRLLPGTMQGDPKYAKYGIKMEYESAGYDQKTGKPIIKSAPRAITEEEYIAGYQKAFGQKISKRDLEKMTKEARTPSGNIKLDQSSPFVQQYLFDMGLTPEKIAQSWIDGLKAQDTKKEAERIAAAQSALTAEINKTFEQNRANSVYYYNLEKGLTEIAAFNATKQLFPNYAGPTFGFKPSENKKPQTTFPGAITPVIPERSQLLKELLNNTDPNKYQTSIQDGMAHTLKPFQRSPSLGVTLDKDNSGIFKRMISILDIIQYNTFKTSLNTAKAELSSGIMRNMMFNNASFTNPPPFRFGYSMFGRGFAAGKSKNAEGGLSMVGERGPELMYVPHNASIVPNGDTNRIAKGDVSKLSKWGIPGYDKGKKGKKEKDPRALMPTHLRSTEYDEMITSQKPYGTQAAIGQFTGGVHFLEKLLAIPMAGSGTNMTMATAQSPFSLVGMLHATHTGFGKYQRSEDQQTLANIVSAQQLLFDSKHGLATKHGWHHFTHGVKDNYNYAIKSYKTIKQRYNAVSQIPTTSSLSRYRNVLGPNVVSRGTNFFKNTLRFGMKEAFLSPAAKRFAIAESVGNLLLSAKDITETTQNTNILTGEELGAGDKWANWLQSFGGRSYDQVDNMTFGLVTGIANLISDGGGYDGVKFPGASAHQSALMRNMYLSSNANLSGRAFVPDNIDVARWIMANEMQIHEAGGDGDLFISLAAKYLDKWEGKKFTQWRSAKGPEKEKIWATLSDDQKAYFLQKQESLIQKAQIDRANAEYFLEYFSANRDRFETASGQMTQQRQQADMLVEKIEKEKALEEDRVKYAKQYAEQYTKAWTTWNYISKNADQIVWQRYNPGKSIMHYKQGWRKDFMVPDEAANQWLRQNPGSTLNIGTNMALRHYAPTTTSGLYYAKQTGYNEAFPNNLPEAIIMYLHNKKMFPDGTPFSQTPQIELDNLPTLQDAVSKAIPSYKLGHHPKYKQNVQLLKDGTTGPVKAGVQNTGAMRLPIGMAANALEDAGIRKSMSDQRAIMKKISYELEKMGYQIKVIGNQYILETLGSGIQPATQNNAQLRAYANGTNFAPGGMALVGERGPEIVNLPRGSEVIPNHKLPAFADGTIGATSALLTANNIQMERLVSKIADAITKGNSESPTQNINLIVDGRQLNNVQFRRQQSRMNARPNDLV